MLRELEVRLDELTVPLLVPLRTSKTLDGAVMADLLALGPDLIRAVSNEVSVPVSLVGKSWFLFTSMLGEADHATAPEPIRDAAWQWQSLLAKAFGPDF
jgi:hypothetical protein